MYLVFNTLALPLVFRAETDATTRLIVGIVGIIVSLFIPLAIYRGNWWSKYFSNKMAELESLDQGNDKRPRVTVFDDDRYKSFSRKRYSSRRLFAPVAVILLSIWIWVTLGQARELVLAAGYFKISQTEILPVIHGSMSCVSRVESHVAS